MTAALQVTDTDVAFRFKAVLNRRLEVLRHDLMKLAELEETRPLFKCAHYEVLRVVVESVEILNFTL